MKIARTLSCLLYIGLLCLFSHAFALTPEQQSKWQFYYADSEQSEWKFKGSILECILLHHIPNYGTSVIINGNGRRPILRVTTQQGPAIAGTAKLLSISPNWRHEDKVQDLGTITIYPGFKPFKILNKQVRLMLSQLKKGRMPIILYNSWHQDPRKVAVGFSPVRFQEVYKEYLKCSAKLLPYSLDDVKLTTIYFPSKQTEITYEDKQELIKVRNIFEREKGRIESIRLDGYADYRGTRLQNWVLTEERIDSVAMAMELLGIPPELLELEPHGEKGSSSKGDPNKQRRVEVRIIAKEKIEEF